MEMNLQSKIYCMRCKKVTATTSMTQAVSKRNDLPMIKGICELCGCKNNCFLKKEAMNKNPG
jgi:hypothetical protein